MMEYCQVIFLTELQTTVPIIILSCISLSMEMQMTRAYTNKKHTRIMQLCAKTGSVKKTGLSISMGKTAASCQTKKMF